MPDPYYAFTSKTARTHDQPITYFERPALGDLREHLVSAQLLAEWPRLSQDARVLCLHCGTGLAGIAAARQVPHGHVTLIDSHTVAVEATRRALIANQVGRATFLLGDCAQPVHGESFDCVLAHLPKGRAAWQQTVLDAAQVLKLDGMFYLAGANRAGIKSASRFLGEVFGNVSMLAYRGGCRILLASKTKQHSSSPTCGREDYYAWRTVETEVGGQPLVYASRPGLFAWKGLDEGTRLLLETLLTHPLRDDDRVWDIGSGAGPLTVLAARQAAHGSVLATDVDCRAHQATTRTITLNKLTNAESQLCDCAETLGGRTFSAVVTNPPFHQARGTTYAIAEQIIREAGRLLGPRGRLYLVANSFLQYKPILDSVFGDAQLLAERRGFKVWRSTRA
jgi:16S rRNA (guanine1207-N2)-methyltransferase